MGGKIGTIFARAGHDVLFSYARTRKKLERRARNAGGSARAGSPRQAAQHGETELVLGNTESSTLGPRRPGPAWSIAVASAAASASPRL
jgi:hypothetical protein